MEALDIECNAQQAGKKVVIANNFDYIRTQLTGISLLFTISNNCFSHCMDIMTVVLQHFWAVCSRNTSLTASPPLRIAP